MQTLNLYAVTIGVALTFHPLAMEGQETVPATSPPSAPGTVPAPAAVNQTPPATVQTPPATVAATAPAQGGERTFRGRVSGKTGSTVVVDGQTIDLRYFGQRVELGDVITGQAQAGANDVWVARTMDIDSAATYQAQQNDRQLQMQRREMRALDRNYVRQPGNPAFNDQPFQDQRSIESDYYQQRGNLDYQRPRNFSPYAPDGTRRPYYGDQPYPQGDPRNTYNPDPRLRDQQINPDRLQPLPGFDARGDQARPNYYWEQQYWRNQQRQDFRGGRVGPDGVFQPNDVLPAPELDQNDPRIFRPSDRIRGNPGVTPGVASPAVPNTGAANELQNRTGPGNIVVPNSSVAMPPSGVALPPAGPAVPPAGPARPPTPANPAPPPAPR